MSLASLLSQSVTITHVAESGAVDDYNQPTPVTTQNTVAGLVQPLGGEEDTFQRTSNETTAVGYFLPGTAIDATDRLVAAGMTYEVVAPPRIIYNPRTRQNHHIEVELTATG